MIFWILLKTLFLKGDVGKKIRFNLFNQHCFEYTNSSKFDRFLFLRELKSLLKSFLLMSSSKKTFPVGVGLYVLSNLFEEDKLKFITSSFENIDFVINKKEAHIYANLKCKILCLFFILVTFPYFFFKTFLSQKNRINNALLIRHVYLSLVLSSYIARNCKKIYFFHPHEPESNLIIKMLETMGIDVTVIPNTNPLFMYNKNIVGNKILLTLGYQVEELLFFNPNFQGSIFLEEDFHLAKYHNNFKPTNNSKICYYSHGSWLRLENNQHIPPFNEVKMELELLEYLKNNNLFKDINLTICLHPKEKENIVLEKAKKYYEDIFGHNIKFYLKNSYESFQEFHIGFGGLSSILFERIHCGYKSIIYENGIDNFPIENSLFNQFVISDLENLSQKINADLATNYENYFQNLKRYTYLHHSNA